jgi:hypothetical protein
VPTATAPVTIWNTEQRDLKRRNYWRENQHSPGTDAFSVGRIILFWLEKLGTTKWNDGDREGEAKAGSPQVGPLCLLNVVVALGLADADPSERWDLE